jgi:hypothetical protein
MTFKQWLEGNENQIDPEENGLKRPQIGIRPVPNSPVADKLFGAGKKRHGRKFIKKMRKHP